MVVKEDGTKWACQSCLKGHRVSGCTHTDRELFFVPKKGRPVTQCPHCRAERKKRASHVKCDCGEKPHTKEKCIHLREAEAKAAAVAAGQVPGATSGDRHSPELPPLAEEASEASPDEHHCCCPHGGQCTCSSVRKGSPSDDSVKDMQTPPAETKPVKDVKEAKPAKDPILAPSKLAHRTSKPRLTSHQSEGHLTLFANGHHKPCHRNNNAAHESGIPYKLPRSHTSQPLSATARRSVDSLATVAASQPQNWFHPNVTSQAQEAPTSAATPAPTSAPTSAVQVPAYQDSRASPDAQPQPFTMPDVSSSVPTSMLSEFGYPSTSSLATSATDSSMPAFSLPSAGIDMSNGFWSTYDWTKLDTSAFDVQPALTNASSGTMSEADEVPAADEMANFDNPYAMNMQGLVSTSNLSTSSNNFDLDFNVGSVQSNRWSMPVNFNQSSASIDMKQPEDRSMNMNQFSAFDFQQANGSGLSSSVQSQSPAPTSMGWDQSIYDFSMGGTGNLSDQMAFSMAGSTTGPSVSPTAAPSPKFNTDGAGFNNQAFDFDNSSKAVDWSDSMLIPASQDFLNTYNYDQNFSTDFNDAWTSS